jgi:hypothetical protein
MTRCLQCSPLVTKQTSSQVDSSLQSQKLHPVLRAHKGNLISTVFFWSTTDNHRPQICINAVFALIFRCFLGQNAGPAQRPDCNRYVEAVIVKLCSIHPQNVRKEGVRIQRWTLVCRDYKAIREMVLNNARVMEETGIQIVEINTATLTQW